MNRSKVFEIDFHKTGTKSLGGALTLLGYRVRGLVRLKSAMPMNKLERIAVPLASDYEAFQDNPWPLLYEPLDRAYPGSKFILTVRPTDAWIASVVKHFGGKTTPMRELIYGFGDPRGNETKYIEVYEAHNRRVVEHFKGRDKDFLVLRITEGEGWERLCPFLGTSVPRAEFPVMNRSENRSVSRPKRALQRWLRKLWTFSVSPSSY